MRCSVSFLVLLTILVTPSPAERFSQTDWSDGAGASGPVPVWGSAYDSCTGVSARSVPGQLALASEPRSPGVRHLISDAYVRSFGVHATDMDGDGDIDVLGAAEASGVVAIWTNDGARPPGWTAQVVDPSFTLAEAVWGGDLDGDGRPDLVATSKGTNPALAWWRNEGGTPPVWTKQIIRRPWGNTYEVCVGDLDRDGDPDLLSTSCTSNEIAWWRNDGGTPLVWTFQVIAGGFSEAHSAWFADLDGDGDNDVVGAGISANEVAWWRQETGPSPTWTKFTIHGQFTGARSVRTGDVDGDGRADVVGTCWDGRVAWWKNDGGEPLLWTEQLLDTQLGGGHSVGLADLDGDGDLDVTAAGFTANTVRWYENAGGSPTLWVAHGVDGACRQAAEVATADVDGDGDLDVLGTSYYDGEFCWWEATTFRATGALRSSILDLQTVPTNWSLSWSGRTPPGGGLAFRVRGADDPEDVGAWTDELAGPGFLGLPPSRFVQLEVRLDGDGAQGSPILDEWVLETNLDPAATGEERGCLDTGAKAEPLFLDVPCPTGRTVTLNYGVRPAGVAVIEVFDARGRQVVRFSDRLGDGANRRSTVQGLTPGLYFCRLSTGAQSKVRRLVVAG